jgi:hypothetical protein
MGKKVKDKEKATKRRLKPKEAVRPSGKEDALENDNPNDFGGIPNRDLKKNLGCG